MLTGRKKRFTLLVAAGLLIGATVVGWIQHARLWKPTEQTTVATARQSVAPPAESRGLTVPSSAPEHGAVAGQSAEERHPERTAQTAAQPAATSGAHVDKQVMVGHRGAQHAQALPPPPPEAALTPGSQTMVAPPPPTRFSTPVASAPLKHLSFSEAVNLVGLVDGKAIFSVQKNYAREHNMPTAFTLGVGQEMHGIKVEKVGDGSATITDGKSICVKDLGPIN